MRGYSIKGRSALSVKLKNQKTKMEYITVNTSDIIGCHPKYHDLFIAKSIDELQGLKNSIMKEGKINPVHLMKKEEGDRPGLYIVDGLSTYTVCDSSGINVLNAIVHPWNDDPSDMMIDLNTDNHKSSKELYLMAEDCYKKLSIGHGFRTSGKN